MTTMLTSIVLDQTLLKGNRLSVLNHAVFFTSPTFYEEGLPIMKLFI